MANQTTSVYLLPCPTMQTRIDQAQSIPEYEGVLRNMVQNEENVLWVNLQDRTSIEEFARCRELEKISTNAEFQPVLSLLTLPVSTSFYMQSEDYLKLHDKKQFKKVFLDQLMSGIDCGFYYPTELHLNKDVFEKIINEVELVSFKDKKELTRKNRLDWIEMVYLFLILKAMEVIKPKHIVFISKDGVDVGAVTMGAMYALIKMLDPKSKWKEGEKEFFVSMHFLPALMERERIVDLHRLNRTISAISVLASSIELKGGKFEGIEKVFSPSFLKELKLLSDPHP